MLAQKQIEKCVILSNNYLWWYDQAKELVRGGRKACLSATKTEDTV
jgi:hypothetical protein